ncbi:hypothetical protein [Asaia lannensis]|uniref:hypothetical protein n=1 Tax=Asaia lannensis TaxID=415421 RepID=UPI003872B2FC
MSKIIFITAAMCLLLTFSSKPYAEENKCYFPDIPSFSEGKQLPNGSPADLSFADYRIVNPKGAALLLSCAQAMYRNANLSQFNDASRKRLDRTMRTTWQRHNTAATAQKDGYIALGGSSELGSANDLGMMIIDPDKKLVAIGLLLNDVDRVDENDKGNFIYSNFVFIYNSLPFADKQDISIPEMQFILYIVNPGLNGTFIFSNEYFVGPKL